MNELFRNGWDTIRLDDVRAFFADAGDEGLTWEAKADVITTKMVGQAVAGFANSVGGYLVLGAKRSDGQLWSLPGVVLPGSEPTTWISGTVRDRLRPVPHFDAKSWPVEDDHHIVVVRVEPVAVPPCLTVDGLAYERVTGQTVKVIDPHVLAGMVQRGEAARLAAGRAARAAADLIASEEPLGPVDLSTVTRMSVGLAATGYTPDISSRLFSQAFANQLDDLAVNRLASVSYSPNAAIDRAPSHTHSTVRFSVRIQGPMMPESQRFGIVASWNGSVSITWETTTRDVHIGDELETTLDLIVAAASVLVTALGGYGETHLATRVSAASGAVGKGSLATTGGYLQRIANRDHGDAFDLSGIIRELQRASGLIAYEPGT